MPKDKAQKWANLTLEIFKNTAQITKTSHSKTWLRELIEWADSKSIWFQVVYEWDLCDEKKLRERIKELAQKRLIELSD